MARFSKRKSHTTKNDRVPRSYKDAQKILHDALSCKASLKSLLYGSKIHDGYLSKVSAMTVKVLSQKNLLEKIIKDVKLLEKEPFLAKELALILVHDIIFRGKLPGESKPIVAVRNLEYDIQLAYKALQKSKNFLNNEIISVPKYTRVNTLLSNLTAVLEDLKNSGYLQIHYEKNITDDEYYNLVKALEKGTFLIDCHFDDILVFASDENLFSLSLVQNRHVLIQDKSSCIPARALGPMPGSTVIDACAAPGMKSLHLAALMKNKGTLFACEKDEQRFQTLKAIVKNGCARICRSVCDDFCNLDPKDKKFCNVEYILLDPSCSGSGMVSRMDCITDTEDSKNDDRINKLAGFQIKLLKHALLFPSVKRVVYSTCSTNEQENEFVVHEVLNYFNKRFQLVNVIPEWPYRGSENFAFGHLCLRAHPAKTLTNGFFVALFERIDECTEITDHKKSSKRKKRRRRNEGPLGNDIDNAHSECIGNAEISSIESNKNVISSIESFKESSKRKKQLHRDKGPLDNDIDNAHSEFIGNAEISSIESNKNVISSIQSFKKSLKRKKRLRRDKGPIISDIDNAHNECIGNAEISSIESYKNAEDSLHINEDSELKGKKDKSMCDLYSTDNSVLKVKKKKHKRRIEEHTQQAITVDTRTESMDIVTDDHVSIRKHSHSSKQKRKLIDDTIYKEHESEERYAEEPHKKKSKK